MVVLVVVVVVVEVVRTLGFPSKTCELISLFNKKREVKLLPFFKQSLLGGGYLTVIFLAFVVIGVFRGIVIAKIPFFKLASIVFVSTSSGR